MKEYLSVIIVTMVCVLAVVLAAFWRVSNKPKELPANNITNVQPSNISIYDDNVTVYQDVN